MYYFKPISSVDEVKEAYDKKTEFSYIGYENDEQSGGCECEIKGNYVEIKKITFPSDKPDFCEGLIRASLNYGANRGAYMAKTKCENADYVLKLLGFEKNEDGYYEGDIPSLLQGSCGKCAKDEI